MAQRDIWRTGRPLLKYGPATPAAGANWHTRQPAINGRSRFPAEGFRTVTALQTSDVIKSQALILPTRGVRCWIRGSQGLANLMPRFFRRRVHHLPAVGGGGHNRADEPHKWSRIKPSHRVRINLSQTQLAQSRRRSLPCGSVGAKSRCGGAVGGSRRHVG